MIGIEHVTVVADGATLLAPVSAHVGQGQVLAVRGKNGSGKSTLLRVLAGQLPPTSGSVIIGRRPARARSPEFRRRVSVMQGLPPLAPDLTASDHVLLVASTWYDDPARARRIAADLLAELELADLAARFPHELSSGQLQLLGLALAVARPFEVLLLDEPEQRLDPDRLRNVVSVLASRRDAGATIVAATHSSVLADALADDALWLGRAA